MEKDTNQPADGTTAGGWGTVRWCMTIFYVAYAALYAGWFMHESRNPVILGYSAGYLVALVLLGLPLLVPTLLIMACRRVGSRKLAFALVPMFVLAATGYGIGWVIHMRAQSIVRFHPFLQTPPTQLVESSTPGDDEFRIAILGGSTSGGHHPRYADTLEKLLNARYGDSVRITVLANDWQTSQDSLINYSTYGLDLDPDMVIVMHGINDLCRSFNCPEVAEGGYENRYVNYYGAAIRAARRTNFSDWWTKPLCRLLKKNRLVAFAFGRDEIIDYPLDRYRSIDELDRNLSRIVQMCEQADKRVFVLTQATIYRQDLTEAEESILSFPYQLMWEQQNWLTRRHPSSRSLMTAMAEVNKRVRRIASESDAVLIDTEKIVPKDATMFVDDCHYTNAGLELIAKTVADAFMEQNVLAPENL